MFISILHYHKYISFSIFSQPKPISPHHKTIDKNNRRHLNSLIVSDSAYCIVTSISNGLYLTNNFFFCFFPYLHLFVYLNDLLGMTSYLNFFFLLFFFSSEALSTSSLLLSCHWFLDLIWCARVASYQSTVPFGPYLLFLDFIR